MRASQTGPSWKKPVSNGWNGDPGVRGGGATAGDGRTERDGRPKRKNITRAKLKTLLLVIVRLYDKKCAHLAQSLEFLRCTRESQGQITINPIISRSKSLIRCFLCIFFCQGLNFLNFWRGNQRKHVEKQRKNNRVQPF